MAAAGAAIGFAGGLVCDRQVLLTIEHEVPSSKKICRCTTHRICLPLALSVAGAGIVPALAVGAIPFIFIDTFGYNGCLLDMWVDRFLAKNKVSFKRHHQYGGSLDPKDKYYAPSVIVVNVVREYGGCDGGYGEK